MPVQMVLTCHNQGDNWIETLPIRKKHGSYADDNTDGRPNIGKQVLGRWPPGNLITFASDLQQQQGEAQRDEPAQPMRCSRR